MKRYNKILESTGECIMCNQNDSIQKFYSDLPAYSKDDFYNGIPYERALSLSKDRETMEDCLQKIDKIGERLALPKDFWLFPTTCG